MILVSSELSMKNNEQFGVNMFGTFNLDGCLYRRVIVRVIIYLAVAVLYCL